MMNQIIVVGRLQKIVDLGDKTLITVANQRPFKNTDGEYKTDYIDFIIWSGIKQNVIEYCKQGDIIGVRGRVQTENEEAEKETILVADKITFLSSNPNLKKGDE